MFYSYRNATVMTNCLSQSAFKSMMCNRFTESHLYMNEPCQHAKDDTVNQCKQIHRKVRKREERKKAKRREKAEPIMKKYRWSFTWDGGTINPIMSRSLYHQRCTFLITLKWFILASAVSPHFLSFFKLFVFFLDDKFIFRQPQYD